MPRTLILLRHAKSDWRAGTAGDHERPLNARGERAAAVIGVYLKEEGLAPDLVLTSTAVRARSTAELVMYHGRFAVPLRAEHALYLADPQQILAVVRTSGGAHRRVLLVAHNPGLEELVQQLARHSPPGVGAAADDGFPTAGLAICEWPGAWADADPATLALTRVVLPKSLV
jgi:phosphohistidine phosphatase